MLTLTVLCAALAAAPAPLDAAAEALRQRRPEEVFFALEGASLAAGEERAKAATLLSEAAALALAGADAPLAVQLCQTSLRHEPGRAEALAVCSAAALAAQLYDAADDYAAQLTDRHPTDLRGPLAAARSAAAQAEWPRVLERSDVVLRRKPAAALAKEARALKAAAESALAERRAALSESVALTARLAAATEQARAMPAARPDETPILVTSGGVVVYKTAWCGACKAAEAWLKSRGVVFTGRDVETDPMAAVELAAKLTARGQTARGVPVIDVGGELLHGFDRVALERAIKQAGLTK